MSGFRNISGTWKAGRFYRNIAGTWKECAVYRNIAGVWKQITTLLSAMIPTTVYASATTATITTASQLCTVSGGTPGYTYAWSEISSDGEITIVSPTAASTQFRGSVMASPEVRSGFFECTVTDSLSNVTTSNEIYVEIERP